MSYYTDRPFMQVEPTDVKLHFNVSEAAERLATDLHSIKNAATKQELEMLVLRLQAEQAAREIHALLAR